MYGDYFGLRFLPFEDRADTQFFYPTTECEEALAALEYEIQHGTGLGLLIGDTGTGKTLLLRTLLLRLRKSDQTVVVTWPASGAMDLVRECCKGFGVTLPSSHNQSRCLNRLRRHLSRCAGAENRSILIVDQAENLSPSNIAQLATLAELCGDRGKLLTIILAAQPLVRALLDRPEFARIRQQLFGERALSPFTPKETGEYIRHRLQIAGAGDKQLFDDRAISLIHEISEGIPRLINRVCNAALLVAYGSQTPRISRIIVEEATVRPAVRERTVAAQDLGLAKIGEGGAPWLGVAESPEPMAGSDESQVTPGSFESSMTPVDIINHEDSDDSWSDANEPSGASIAHGEYEGFNGESFGSGPNEVTFLLARLERAMARATRKTSSSEASITRLVAAEKHLAAQVERHTSDVESRLVRVSDIAAQTEDSALRIERACALAGDVESRLTAFAERLADKADEVQHRVTTLMNGVQTTEATQTRLAAVVEQAASATRKSEEALATVRSQIRTAIEEGERELQRRSEVEVDRIERLFQERIKICERVGQATVEKTQAKLDPLLQRASAASADADSMIERQRTAARETMETIQTKVDVLLQRVSATTAEADDKMNTLTVALQRTIAEGQQARQRLTADSLERHRAALRDQFLALEHSAQETIDSSQGKLDAILKHVTSAAADTDSTIERQRTAARETVETIQTKVDALLQRVSTTTAEADDKMNTLTVALQRTIAEGQQAQQRLTADSLERHRAALHDQFLALEHSAQETIDSSQGKLEAILKHVTSAAADAERRVEVISAPLKTATVEGERLERHLIETLPRRCREEFDSLFDQHRNTLSGELASMQQVAAEAVDSAKSWLDGVLRYASSATMDTERVAESLTAKLKTAIEESEGYVKQFTETLPRRCREELQELTDTATSRVRQIEQKLDDVTARQADARSAVNDAAKKIDVIETQVSVLSETVRDAQAVVEDLPSRVQTVTSPLAETVQHGAQLLQEVQATGERIADLRQQVASSLIDIGIGCERVAVARAQAGDFEQLATARQDCQAAAKQLEAVVRSADQIHDALQGLTAHADEKVDRLASHHAAASHILDRLSAANVTGHQFVERLGESGRAVEESIAKAQSQIDRITEDVSSLTTTAQTVTGGLAGKYNEAAGLLSDLTTLTSSAAHLVHDLGRRVEQAGEHTKRMAVETGGAEKIVERLSTMTQVFAAAEEVSHSLRAIVESGRSMTERIGMLNEAAAPQCAALDSGIATAQRLIERQEGLCEDASAAAERLATKLAAATNVFEAEEDRMRDFAASADALRERIEKLDGNTSDIQSRIADWSEGPTAIVENAQTQAAKLERVCGAVRKVFANLAEATLKAQHLTEKLRGTSEDTTERLAELTAQTERATRTLHEWVEEAVRTQTRLERTMGECPPLRQTHPTEAVRRLSRAVEPFARRTVEVAGGQLQILSEPDFDTTPVGPKAAKQPTRAEEIARLISEAKQQEAGAPA